MNYSECILALLHCKNKTVKTTQNHLSELLGYFDHFVFTVYYYSCMCRKQQ